jgi:hypothetical protein
MFIPRVIDIATNPPSPLPGMMACDDIYHCRTLSNIILSCASTVFLCTWVSLHPDVPDDLYEPWWKVRNYDGILKNRVVGDWVHSCEGLTRVKGEQI